MSESDRALVAPTLNNAGLAGVSVSSPVSTSVSLARPLFSLGVVVATPAALALLAEHGMSSVTLITRHIRGDWGCVSAHDAEVNTDALRDGHRLLSVYPVPAGGTGENGEIGEAGENRPTGRCIWVITEADRSMTTLLLPEDY